MRLSILQLNMNGDNFWDNLTAFLAVERFDIIQLQEVGGKDSRCGSFISVRDCFTALQTILAPTHRGELAVAARFTSSPTSSMGNATFYRNKFTLLKKFILTLNQHAGLFRSDSENYEQQGRNLLHLTLDIGGKTVSFLNTHSAWAHRAIEEPHQTAQGEIVVNYLQNVAQPFVFSGDLNLDPAQPLIQKINRLARNLTTEYAVTNTLNPRTHRAKEIFPKGVAVDYIFVSGDIKVTNLQVLSNLDLSDHFGLTVEIEI